MITMIRSILVEFVKSELVKRYLLVVLLLITFSVECDSTRAMKVDSTLMQCSLVMLIEMSNISIGCRWILLIQAACAEGTNLHALLLLQLIRKIVHSLRLLLLPLHTLLQLGRQIIDS
ncbi:hypothetical protein PMAYCL1PPCAC_04269, partial [Pristionchus mayeri]